MKKKAIQIGAVLLGLFSAVKPAATFAQTAASTPAPTAAAAVDETSGQAARAQQTAPDALAGPSPSVVPVEPPSIIPPNTLPGPGAATLPQIPSAPELQQLSDLFKQSSLGKEGDEHRLHVEMASLKVLLRNDADLHRLRAAADLARTDLERRHAFRAYYEFYYGKLISRAQTPELQAYLKEQRAAHELTLLQPRVRHETDEAEAARLALAQTGATATPAATPVQARINDIFRQ